MIDKNHEAVEAIPLRARAVISLAKAGLDEVIAILQNISARLGKELASFPPGPTENLGPQPPPPQRTIMGDDLQPEPPKPPPPKP